MASPRRSFLKSLATLASAVPLFRPGSPLPAASAPYVSAPLEGAARRPTRLLRQSLRASTVEGMFAEVVGACTAGTVLTGWALHLGCGPLWIGVLSALPFLGQLIQLPAAFLSGRLGARRVCIAAVTGSRQALLPLVALPFLPVPVEAKQALLVAVAGVSALLGVLGNNAWVTWMGDLVPHRIRGRYFGPHRALHAGGDSGHPLGGAGAGRGEALGDDWLRPRRAGAGGLCCGRGHHLPAHPAARAGGGWSERAVRRLARSADGGRSRRPPLPRLPAAVEHRHRGVRRLLRPAHAGEPPDGLHPHRAARGGGGRGADPPRAALGPSHRSGRRTPGAGGDLVRHRAHPFYWTLATESFLWPIALDVVVSAALWSGHGLATFNLPLNLAPRDRRSFYLATFAMAGGVAYSGAALVGGWVLSSIPARFELLGQPAFGVHLLFGLSAVLRLAGASLALRIVEPGARPVEELARLLRAGLDRVGRTGWPSTGSG